MLKYNRILLKLSGEALQGEDKFGINTTVLMQYAKQIKEIVQIGVQVGIVIGGGNIFRGLKGVDKGFDRVKGDYMGMLATVINGLAIQSSLESIGQKAHVLTAIQMTPFAEHYSKDKSINYLSQNHVVIFTAGTGNPFFTTDTAASLRAVEIDADILLKGTRVDGVYTADPEKDKSAIKFEQISFEEVIDKELKVMDLTAFAMCKENNMPIMVFDMNTEGNLKKIVMGEKPGTLVS